MKETHGAVTAHFVLLYLLHLTGKVLHADLSLLVFKWIFQVPVLVVSRTDALSSQYKPGNIDSYNTTEKIVR
jgi:hypothetical protein